MFSPFPEREFETEAATFISTSQSFTSQPLGSAGTTRGLTTPQTAVPDPTPSSVLRHVAKLGFEILSTTPDLWEQTISRQEGSTSIDTEDREEKLIDATPPPKQVVSGVSLPMTESPEGLNVSHSPSEFATEQYQTGYGVPISTANSYEEASGFELGIVTSIFQEIKVAPPFEQTLMVSSTHDKEGNSPIVIEEETIVPSTVVLREEATVGLSTEKQTKVAPTLAIKGDTNVPPTFAPVEETKVSPTLGLKENNGAPALVVEEDAKITPTAALEEKDNVVSTLVFDGETKGDPYAAEEAKVGPPLVSEEVPNVDPTVVLEEEIKASPDIVFQEGKVTPTLVPEEEANVDPTFVLEEETKASPTLVFQEVKFDPILVVEENKGGPTLVVEEEVKVTPTVALEEESKHLPTTFFYGKATFDPNVSEEGAVTPHLVLKQEANVEPTVAEEGKVAPTLILGVVIDEQVRVSPEVIFEENAEADPTLILKEEATVASAFKEEAEVNPTLIHEEPKATPNPHLEDKANVPKFENTDETNNFSGVPDGESEVTPTLVTDNLKVTPVLDFEEETYIAPTLDDFTVFPLNSQTSKWSLLTTTTGPQEHLRNVNFSEKPPFLSVSETSVSTKSTSTSPAMTSPTHVPRRTWSPGTTRPHISHKTAEPQKVNHFMPPLDHGVVDFETSLTPPPTLLILPNERAAVGGTLAFSGNAKTTLINLTVVFLLSTVTH